MTGPHGATGPGLSSDPGPATSVVVRGLDLSAKASRGVALESLHWEHYCQRIEDMDMPSLDEANFFTGSAGVAISMLVSLVGVSVGTTKPSPYLIMVFVALLVSSFALALFFGLQYRIARRNLKKAGTRISTEMRAVATAQGAAVLETSTIGSEESAGFRVVFAVYGVPGKEAEVADRLNELTSDDGVLDFIADNATLGVDPAPGEAKLLRLRWTSNGLEKASAYNEGTHVVIR